MPTYPSLQTQKLDEPIDLSNIQYPISERFMSSFNNAYEHSQYNSIVNNRPVNPQPVDGYPGTFPTTQKDIDDLKLERPGLPNIPTGIPKYLALAVASIYDNDRSLDMMRESEPSMLGKAAAFGGSFAGSMLDIKALITSIGTGGAGGVASKTIGKWGMTKLGASELFGSKAANIGTQIVQNGITFGAGNIGYQASRELQETQSRDIMQQPQDYLQSLQNVGVAGAEGFGLGALLGTLGIAVLGRRVMRFEDGSYVEMPPEGTQGTYVSPEGDRFPESGTVDGKKWTASREGGLFNRTEFSEYTPEQKEHIADNFKPWTKDSEVTMTEDAAGQMMNGQVVKVDPIMKQGIFDAGETFKQAMRDGNIDLETLDGTLSEAHDNVKAELAEAIRQSEELHKSTKELKAKEGLPVTDDKDLSQAGILKRAEMAQFEESIMKQSPELVPENVRKFIEIQKEIQRLTDKIEQDKQKQLEAEPEKTAAEVEPNKKVVKRIESLKKRLPKIQSAKAELKAIRTKLLDTVGTPEYGTGEAYQRLSELSNVWRAAKELKDNLDQHHTFENKISDLASHDFIIQAMRDHINDGHEPATHADMQDYADNLQSTGIPESVDTAAEFEPKAERDIDAYIQEYSPDEVKALTEAVGDEAYAKEVEAASKKLSMVEKMRTMVQSMTDCLMKESL